MAKLFLVDATVVENKPVSQKSVNHRKIIFSDKKIAGAFRPGQFVTIDCGRYLRRPFSIAGVSGGRIEILYKIAGAGTHCLAGKRKGQTINVMGPLGNGFRLPGKYESVVAVAGGTGIAPIMALSQALDKSGILFYGVKTRSELMDTKRLTERGWKIFVATQDGSAGVRGTAVELANEHLEKGDLFSADNPVVYAAGPRLMLKEVAASCKKNGTRGQASVEEVIACGVGACRGCVVKVKNGKGGYENKTVCKDGPVFDIGEIIW